MRAAAAADSGAWAVAGDDERAATEGSGSDMEGWLGYERGQAGSMRDTGERERKKGKERGMEEAVQGRAEVEWEGPQGVARKKRFI